MERAIKAQVLWSKLSQYKEVKGQGIKKLSRKWKINGRAEPGRNILQALYLTMQTEGSPENLAWINCKGFLDTQKKKPGLWAVVQRYCYQTFRPQLRRTSSVDFNKEDERTEDDQNAWAAEDRMRSSPKLSLFSSKTFLSGIILSWVVFLFCIVGFRVSMAQATWTGAILTTTMSFGLAFSSIFRCYVLMLLPQLFSKRGRQAMVAYAFLLALGGPAKNSIHNLRVLSSSLACGQEQVKRCMRQLVEMVREPLSALTATLEGLIKDIGKVVRPIREVVVRISRAFTAVFGVISSVASWLGNIASVCNKETGTPYQRCVRSLDEAIADCVVKLGIMKFLCSVVTAVKQTCLVVKVVDALCVFMDVITDAVVGTAKRKLATFREHMADMLYVSIEIDHSVDINTTASRSIQDVVTAIMDDVEERTQKVRILLNWVPFLPAFAFMLLLLKVYIYWHKFMTSDRYDNRYIGPSIVEIDLARIRRNLSTAMPLELRERQLYTTVTSIRLIKRERRRLVSAFFFLALMTMQICSYLICDQGIYWTVQIIRKQALFSTVSYELPTTYVDVQGHGAVAALYQEVGDAFKPPSPNIDLDPVLCLPEASHPEIHLYIKIGVLITASWFMALTEPYGLRLRHLVMCYYYPARARQRSVWLHNKILFSRNIFTQLARDKLRRPRRQSNHDSTATCWQKLIISNAILQRIFGGRIKNCVLCATIGSERTSRLLIPCPATDCSALYCPLCLPSVDNCILCYEPMDKHKRTVITEVRDSSDEEISEDMIESSCTHLKDRCNHLEMFEDSEISLDSESQGIPEDDWGNSTDDSE